MPHVDVIKNCILTKKAWKISAFPDVTKVKNAQENYNRLYGVNPTYYPAPYKGHKGTDYLTPQDVPIYGIDGCKVVSINAYGTGLGNHIEFGNDRIIFKVAHLSRMNVEKGQTIDSEMIIGYTGNTGVTQGPHLHVETWFGDVLDYVDSTPYMHDDYKIPFPGDPDEKRYPKIEREVGYTANGEEIATIYNEYGRYYFTKDIPCPVFHSVTDAFCNRNVKASYVKGEGVDYKRVIASNRYRYIVYVGGSGKTCYIPVYNFSTGWAAGYAK